MASFEIDLDASGAEGPASKLTDTMGGLVQSMSGAGGASDGLTSKMGGLAEGIDPVTIAATIAVAAIGALAAALYEGVAAAISINQQRDALRSTFDALGGGAGAGDKTLAMLDKLGKTLPFTTDQLGKWAKSLMTAGLQGPELEKAINAVASATAIMGETGGAAADKLIKKLTEAAATGGKVKIDKGMLKQLAASGVSAKALADELGTTPDKLAKMNLSAKQLGDAMQNALIKHGKGPLEDLALTWSSISGKLADGFKSLFTDLGPDVKAFMSEVKSLFAEFDKGSTAANGAKGVVTSVLGTILKTATKVVNGIHIGFLQLYLIWLKASAALKPISDKLKELLPAGSGVAILVGILKGLAVVFAVIAVAVIIALIPLMLLAAAVIAVGYAIYAVGSAIVDAVSWLMDLGQAAGEAGINFVEGLINGIGSMASALISAVVGLAGSAVDALASALHLGSPSKLTMKMGGFTTQGLADGIESGTDDVHAAAKGAGNAAIAGTALGLDGSSGAVGAPGAAAGGASGLSVVVQAGAIVINGATGDATDMTQEAITLLFEKIALQSGLAAA